MCHWVPCWHFIKCDHCHERKHVEQLMRSGTQLANGIDSSLKVAKVATSPVTCQILQVENGLPYNLLSRVKCISLRAWLNILDGHLRAEYTGQSNVLQESSKTSTAQAKPLRAALPSCHCILKIPSGWQVVLLFRPIVQAISAILGAPLGTKWIAHLSRV